MNVGLNARLADEHIKWIGFRTKLSFSEMMMARILTNIADGNKACREEADDIIGLIQRTLHNPSKIPSTVGSRDFKDPRNCVARISRLSPIQME